MLCCAVLWRAVYACRSDPGVILTAARFFGPQLALTGLVANKLTVSVSCAADALGSHECLSQGTLRPLLWPVHLHPAVCGPAYPHQPNSADSTHASFLCWSDA